ncbi:MAG TPA: gamma-glutamyl-gamma-aminobutyrate hydrolase family protein [Aridibacter sp.]|nr:gamma-glutamyl-gamma-aminobutyrate hydrolase family protein [Aridibacter sp.]
MFDAAPALHNTLSLPFPYNQKTFCRYEPIEQKIDHARVLIVNDLLRYESDLSDLAREEWKGEIKQQLRLENKLSQMACDNIAKNVQRLVKQPKTLTVHLSEIAEAAESFEPEAIVLSGTLSDFDQYNPEFIAAFNRFITRTTIPVLGICGGHQLVGQAFGGVIKTLDGFLPHEKRNNRVTEFQYRYVKIIDTADPIFAGLDDPNSGIWQDYTLEGHLLRVWQNHGLEIVGVPDRFKHLAKAYLCENQMMVKRSEGQLIYTVQFHLEKSFEDWSKNPTRWEHPNESRDGRILFENFLILANEHIR